MHAFWWAATKHSHELLSLFDRTELTVDEWKRQRETYQGRDASDPVRLGFATFFLNRTNRSGIMNAGVIGGQAQQGKYKIDARFNRPDLRRKLQWIGANAERIDVRNQDGVAVLDEFLPSASAFCYIDPPYFDKGAVLYMNSFDEGGHKSLAGLMHRHRDSRWVLTYDDVTAIRSLYLGLHQGTFSLPYSAHRASIAKERMVLSDPVASLESVMGT